MKGADKTKSVFDWPQDTQKDSQLRFKMPGVSLNFNKLLKSAAHHRFHQDSSLSIFSEQTHKTHQLKDSEEEKQVLIGAEGFALIVNTLQMELLVLRSHRHFTNRRGEQESVSVYNLTVRYRFITPFVHTTLNCKMMSWWLKRVPRRLRLH